MPQISGDVASFVQQLAERVSKLERRLSALENASPKPVQTSPRQTVAAGQLAPAPTGRRARLEAPNGLIPVLGRAVLGMAGAYLLRAIAESGPRAQVPALIVAIVYACFWMVWAVRAHAGNHFASATYGVTATLILSPLLWESTVRFQVLHAASSALVLVAFVILVLVVAWHQNLQLLPWVVTLASVATAWALIFATHELVPLTSALLAIALVTEAAACLGHRLSLRAIAAIAVDSAVLLLIYVMTSSQGVPESYHAASSTTVIALCVSLLIIYGGSIGIRSFGLCNRITNFEIVQAVVAFLLAGVGTLRSNGAAAPVLGGCFLLLSAICYWGALSRFVGEPQVRNRRISASWAGALLLAGSYLLLPVRVEVPFLSVAAVLAVFLYRRAGKLTLAVHVSFYLAAAAAVSPLPEYARQALTGTVPMAPDWKVWVVLASALVCYGAGARPAEERWTRRLLWLTPAVLASFAIAALAVVAIRFAVASRFQLQAPHLSGIRTVVTCLLALGLGYVASQWRRAELGWVAYGAVGFGAVKLLLEDLRFGNAASLVVSLLFYGLILILLPRIMRRGLSES
jgi:hypothetical protein